MTTHLQDMTQEQLLAMLGDAQAKIAALQKAGQGKLTLKVSKGGGVSVYGMGRWPVTLYAAQWARLFDNQAQIKDFMTANEALLSTGKDDARFGKSED